MEIFIVLTIFGSITTIVLGIRYMRHRERLAELYVRRLEALGAARHDAPEADRDHLARELLDAYEEVGRDPGV